MDKKPFIRYNFLMNITKNLAILFIAILSLMNVAIHSLKFTLESDVHSQKVVIKNEYLLSSSPSSIQRSNFKEKRTYKAFQLDFFSPSIHISEFFFQEISKAITSPNFLVKDQKTLNILPRAPPALT